MNKELISIIQPFAFEQKIYIFEDRNLVLQASTSLQKLTETIIKLAYQDDINNIHLRGDKIFGNKIKEETEKQELTQYGNNTLNITVE